MSTAERQSIELCPINEIDDRRQAMRRVIGPLCTLATVEAIDRVSESEPLLNDTAEHVANLSGDTYAMKDTGWLARGYGRLKNALLMQVSQDNALGTISQDQTSVMDTFTYNEQLHALFSEGFDAQRNVTFRLAVPGTIAARHSVHTISDLLESVADYTASDVAQLMAEPDFVAGIKRLSMTRNGLYGPFNGDYASGKPAFQRKLSAQQPKTTLYDMFESHAGKVTLSNTCVKELNESLQLQPDSRGCPVNLRATYVRPEDFREEQWLRMTDGENPIMSYNEGSQKLVIERDAITALNGLFAAVISRVQL